MLNMFSNLSLERWSQGSQYIYMVSGWEFQEDTIRFFINMLIQSDIHQTPYHENSLIKKSKQKFKD